MRLDYAAIEEKLMLFPMTYKELYEMVKSYCAEKNTDEAVLISHDFFDYAFSKCLKSYFNCNQLDIQDYIDYKNNKSNICQEAL